MFKGVSKETKVGSLTAIAITVLILGYNFMIGKDNPFKGSRNFYVLFDSTSGLTESTPLVFNGFRIGQLRKMSLDEKTKKVKVALEVYNDLEIPNDSKIKIESDLLGTKKLRLNLGKNKTFLEEGGMLTPEYTKDVMGMLSEKVSPIAANADSLLANLNALIKRSSVQRTFDNIPVLMSTVEAAIAEIKATITALKPSVTGSMSNLEKFTASLETYNSSIDATLKSFSKLGKQIDSISLVQLMANLDKTVAGLNGVVTGIQNGEGTLGKLATDKELYNSLVRTTTTLECFVRDFKTYPEKYLPLPWGKKQRKNAKEKSEMLNNCTPPDSSAGN